MTATRKFIKDAVDGDYPNLVYLDTADENSGQYRILLDPLAWQAVGRTRNWPDNDSTFENVMEWWKARMIGFMGLLASGLSIEDALKAIE